MLPKITDKAALYATLKYEAGFTDYGTKLEQYTGDKLGDEGSKANELASAYGVGGYYYDGLALTIAKLNDFELLEFVQKYPTPQAWCKRMHFNPRAAARYPDNWADYLSSIGAPVPTV